MIGGTLFLYNNSYISVSGVDFYVYLYYTVKETKFTQNRVKTDIKIETGI